MINFTSDFIQSLKIYLSLIYNKPTHYTYRIIDYGDRPRIWGKASGARKIQKISLL